MWIPSFIEAYSIPHGGTVGNTILLTATGVDFPGGSFIGVNHLSNLGLLGYEINYRNGCAGNYCEPPKFIADGGILELLVSCNQDFKLEATGVDNVPYEYDTAYVSIPVISFLYLNSFLVTNTLIDAGGGWLRAVCP